MIRLVAFDLDGTLLHQSNEASQASWDVIQALLDRGVRVASVSGRNFDRNQIPFHTAPKVADALYVGGYNGALAFAPRDEGRRELMYEQRLTPEVFNTLMAYISDKNMNFIYCRCDLEGDDISEVYITDRDTELGRAVAAMTDMTYELDAGLVDRIRTGRLGIPPKIMLLPEPDQVDQTLADLKRIFGDQVYLAWAVVGRIEVMHAQVDKSVALKAIADHAGIPMADVMAVGDGNNDLPMLKAAGVGVVMGNADPATMAAGVDMGLHVTSSVEEEGFAVAVRKFVLDV
ncbi:MAG: HAD-IIB family hydrolase [Candidatus Latescibacteria bacterium]|nr:HAD-IIB family hydrolase [Candidatus Latescibacterota bacterium]MBT4138310.1 HAD-IIB family hydrolase [Candidatus Latescibacterota bacterium]